ncbi:putative ARM repeat protein [Forsythia ovata]|uniref:ARM repeat protein n=1 Tax=Forsythia ovata TaxID=205694 RepID=A0ABD1UBV5_9LAMI
MRDYFPKTQDIYQHATQDIFSTTHWNYHHPTYFRGKKDACTTLYSLCSVKKKKIRAVQSGIMKPLVELMADFLSNMVDKLAFVLVEIVEVGTQRQKVACTA